MDLQDPLLPASPGLSPAAELPSIVDHCASFPRHPLSATPLSSLLLTPSVLFTFTARISHPSLAYGSVYFHILLNVRFSPPQGLNAQHNDVETPKGPRPIRAPAANPSTLRVSGCGAGATQAHAP